MGNGNRYSEGDRVFKIERIGHGEAMVERRYTGTVIDVGAKGVRVKYDDPKQRTRWVPNGFVKVLEHATNEKPARVEVNEEPPRSAPLTHRMRDVPPPVIVHRHVHVARPSSVESINLAVEVPPQAAEAAPAPAATQRSKLARDFDAMEAMAKELLANAKVELDDAKAAVEEARAALDEALMFETEAREQYEHARTFVRS